MIAHEREHHLPGALCFFGTGQNSQVIDKLAHLGHDQPLRKQELAKPFAPLNLGRSRSPAD